MEKYYIQWLGKNFVIPTSLVFTLNLLIQLVHIVTIIAIIYFGFSAMNHYLGTHVILNISIMFLLLFKLTLNNDVYQILPDLGKEILLFIFSMTSLYYVWKEIDLEQYQQVLFSIGLLYVYIKFIYKFIIKIIKKK